MGKYERDTIKLGNLLRFLEDCRVDLVKIGEHDSALRFEILHQSIQDDYKGGALNYTSKMIGL